MTRAGVVVAALLGLLLPACGGSSLQGVSSVRLQVEVRADREGSLETGLVICDDRQASGTGLFEEAEAAARACDAIRSNEEVQRMLLDGPAADRPCAELYGGPQLARVVGVIDDREVDLRIDREDGCGIDDWRRLEPLIGSPPEPPQRSLEPGA